MTKTPTQLQAEIDQALRAPEWEAVASLSSDKYNDPQEILDRLRADVERRFRVETMVQSAHYPTYALLVKTNDRAAVKKFVDDWLYDLAPPPKATSTKADAKTKRAVRTPKSPSKTKETAVVVNGYKLKLRPAKMTTTYDHKWAGGARHVIDLAKKTEDTWLVVDGSGLYVGTLQEGSGERPWGVQKLKTGPRGAILRGLEEVSSNIRDGETWTKALENSWWA